jgi:hypothetical protein
MNRYRRAESGDSEAGTVTCEVQHTQHHESKSVLHKTVNKDTEQLQVLINRVYDNM